MVAPMVGSGGSLESDGRFCIRAFSGTWLQPLRRFSTFYLFYKEILEILYFNVICKDNSAVNCITVQHKKFIPVNFDGIVFK
jgi:hypothetical protein